MSGNVYGNSGKLTYIFLMLLFPCIGLAQTRVWEVGLSGGAAYNFRTPLTIRQSGEEVIDLKAFYKTDPFRSPPYYDIKITTVKANKGLALKLTHHKLILKNLTPDIQRFSITDGFNLLTINRVWLKKGFAWSLGGGIVITHPESTIRHTPFPENKGMLSSGYYVSGPTVEAAIHKRYFFVDRWFISGEGRATASYVQVPVSGGHARVTNVALHILFGVGFQFKS